MTTSYVIPDDLLARCVGKAELVQRVLNGFIRQLDEEISKRQNDLADGDFEEAARTAHRLKGASANVAAEQLRATAEELVVAQQHCGQ